MNFIQIGNKIVNTDQLLFVTSTRNPALYRAHFKGEDKNIMWLKDYEFAELQMALFKKKPTKNKQ